MCIGRPSPLATYWAIEEAEVINCKEIQVSTDNKQQSNQLNSETIAYTVNRATQNAPARRARKQEARPARRSRGRGN